MMILFLLTTVALYIYKVRFSGNNDYFSDYSSKENTTLLQGVLVILVFFRHLSEYLTDITVCDHIFLLSEKIIGQMMVGGFLFLSGFGVMQSFLNKKGYLDSFWKRFLRVLIPFDIAVLIFLCESNYIGNTYSISHIILSFVGYHSVGNSNWYIFAVLIAYALFYVCFKVAKKIDHAVLLFIILSAGYCYLISFVKEDYWYSTFMCFSAGIVFSKNKERIDQFIQKSKTQYWIVFISLLVLTCIFNVLRYRFIICYMIAGIFFCLSMMVFAMKVLPYQNNKALEFLGKHTFSIYILQRVPMILISYYFPDGYNNFVFSLFSLVATLLLAYGFDYLTSKLMKKIGLK